MKQNRISRMGIRFLGIGLIVCLASMARAEGEKLAAPSPTEQDAAVKLVRDIFKAQYGDNTSAGRKKLAKDLLAQAEKSSDEPVARFVLLREARDASAQALDMAMAFDAIDQMEKYYLIDAPAQKGQILTAVISRLSPKDAATAAGAGLDLVEKLIAADNYAGAQKLISPIQTAVGKAKDDALKARLKDDLAAMSDYERIRVAMNKLQSDPNDPGANLAVGKFYCFVRGDIAKGGPMLALCSDAKLKPLGLQEKENPTEAPKQKELADAWFDFAQTQPAKIKTIALTRSGEWYTKAQPTLGGLMKIAVDKRLELIAKTISLPTVAAKPIEYKLNEWVDLLKLVDPAQDSIKGDWKLEGTLSATNENVPQRIVLPVIPEGDYDMQVTFARMSGTNDIGIVFPVGRWRTMLLLGGWNGNDVSGLHQVNGQSAEGNPTTVHNSLLTNARPYTADIHVRLLQADAQVQIEMNGKLFINWHGPQSALTASPIHALPDPRTPGLYVGKSSTTFASVKLKMLTGKLTPLRQPVADPGPGWTDLLKDANPARDAILGDWKMEGKQLRVVSNVGCQRMTLPFETHGAYDLQLQFTRNADEGNISVMFPVGAAKAHFVLSGNGGAVSGLNIRGFPILETPAGVRPGKIISHREYALEIKVVPEGENASITIQLDGAPYLAWKGPQGVLCVHDSWTIPTGKSFGVGSGSSTATFSAIHARVAPGQKIQETKNTPGLADAIDLLKVVDPVKNAINGTWKRDGDAITTDAVVPAGHQLYLPASTEGQYDLQATFIRTAGDSDVTLTFPAGIGRTSLVLGMGHGNCSGLEMINDARVNDNGTAVRNLPLANNVPHTIELSVRLKGSDAEVIAVVDGKRIVQWTGPQNALHTRPDLRNNVPKQAFSLATYQSAVKFTSAKIKMISGQLREASR